MTKVWFLLGMTLITSCLGPTHDNVVETISSADSLNGSVVNVTGRLETSHSLLNLYSIDRKRCIGLILDRDELDSLKQHVGKNVSVKGELVARGCGSNIICDEHLCGPVNLREVSLTAPL